MGILLTGCICTAFEWDRPTASDAWIFRRMCRLEAHAVRISAELRRLGPLADFRPRCIKEVQRRPVWCVELRRCFPSTTAAAQFVGRRPCNIATAIARRGQCGGFTWQDYDPKRHHTISNRRLTSAPCFRGHAAADGGRHRKEPNRACARP